MRNVEHQSATVLAAEKVKSANLLNTVKQREAAARKRGLLEAAAEWGDGADVNASERGAKKGKGKETFEKPCSFCNKVGHYLRDCTAPGADEKRAEIAAARAVERAGKGKGKDKDKQGGGKTPWWKLTSGKKGGS